MPVALKAQELQPIDTLKVMDDIPWEKLFETGAEDEENSSAVDDIEQLEDNPIDLNTASLEELHSIPAITNVIASRIIARRELAPFTSINELASIDGMTREMLSFIRLFALVKQVNRKQKIAGKYLNRTSIEIEKRKGYIDNIYPGSRIKNLSKFRISAGDKESPLTSVVSKIEAGILTEKDPGERSLRNFSSGFGCITMPVLAAKLIIGNYQVEAAEGLIFWRASAFLRGSDVIAPARKNGSRISPYLSTNENSFLQGTAFSLDINCLQLQMFYSDKSINATLDTLDQISSIDQAGLFRTENELSKKNSTREVLLGGRVIARIFQGLKLGGTAYRTKFRNPFILKNENGEAAYRLWMKGFDVSYTNHKIDLFTELAVDRSHKTAVIGGIIYEPTTSLSFSLIARNYPPGFQSIHGNAFGESGRRVQNENGVYVGVRIHTIDRLLISTYYDQFNYPKPTNAFPVSSHGNDFLAFAEFQTANDCDFSIRFKRKEKLSVVDESDLYGRTVKRVIPRIQENCRFNSELVMSASIRLVSRIEWAKVMYAGMKKTERGLLISQTIKGKVLHKITLRARIAVFETDSYDSKIYEYEDDLTHVSFNPALYGRGLRWYFLSKCSVFKNLDMGVKYSQTIKEGIKSISSGLDEIEGDTQSMLSLQIYVRF